jgi:hypothetical protein
MLNDGTSLEYNVKDLIKVIKENREKHKSDYDYAVQLYKEKLVQAFEKHLGEAREGKEVPHDVGLVKPVEYLKDYDRAIKMYEMTSQTTVTLDQNTFSQLVMDEWAWKNNFNTNTFSYVSAASV